MNRLTKNLAVLALYAGSFPATAQQFELESHKVEIDVLECQSESIQGCEGTTFHRLTVTSRRDDHKKFVDIKNRTASIAEIVEYGSKIVILGSLAYGGEITTIVDIQTGDVIDEFRSYGLARSKDGRYYLYQHWFPRFSDRSRIKSLVFLYDLEQSPVPKRIDTQHFGGSLVFPVASYENGELGPGSEFISEFRVTWLESRNWAVFTATSSPFTVSLVVVRLDKSWPLASVCEVFLLPTEFQSLEIGISFESKISAATVSETGDGITISLIRTPRPMEFEIKVPLSYCD